MRYPKGSKLVPKAWRKMYPNGYPMERGRVICGEENKMLGTICIIDNSHEGRAHFGPDGTGRYHQWGLAGKEQTIEQGRKPSQSTSTLSPTASLRCVR